MQGIGPTLPNLDPMQMGQRNPLQRPQQAQAPAQVGNADRLAPGVDAKAPSLDITQGPTQSFADRVEGFVSGVNIQTEAAHHMVEDFATGKHNDIHGTMLAVEKAQISMKLLGSVRNKALEAYREVMRMGA